MKKLSVLLVLSSTVFFAKAQLLLQPLGQIDKEDLEMKTCDIDPEAEAYTLIKMGETSGSIIV